MHVKYISTQEEKPMLVFIFVYNMTTLHKKPFYVLRRR